ncbi:MAG TPA: hypothetical protein VHO70_04925 [Chitinispirillaceae bacterium]|nr:hypothetical protein [Chitinispirillaceae bacterium]
MNIYRIIIIITTLLFIISCATNKKFVRVSPEFQTVRESIDSIAVLSDAIAAINKRDDYYSVNSSYTLDSLILYGVTKSLSKKGYVVTPIQPCLIGSFLDTTLTVPIKPLNNHSIKPDVLPYRLPCELSSSQQDAIRRINRKLYLNMVYADSEKQNSLFLSDQTRTDLSTIANLTNNKYALFIFHQADLVDPDVTAAMRVVTVAASTLLSGGMIFWCAGKTSIFHNYLMLLELSTGKVLWSNYTPYDAAPTKPILERAGDYENPITKYIRADSLSKYVLNRWYNYNLEPFPNRSKTTYFKGYTTRNAYPSKNYFAHVNSSKSPIMSNSRLLKSIDSLITELSLAENVVDWSDNDTTRYIIGKGRSLSSIHQEFLLIDEYLNYAYYSRLKFNPALNGNMKLSFIITANGKMKRIRVLKTSLDDNVMNYVIPRILQLVKLSPCTEKTGVTETTHDVKLGRNN